ncbi:hypothetical protein HDU76_002474 [Blyttiomyces sp. JEL0837]|nr:hypothetical protein HDU76_002474 [Blyttiomyces sp. JEL0837]
MATYDDLKDALRSSLESRGVLADVKAKMRAEVFKSLHEETMAPPQLHETNVINELIIEYMRFHGYRSSLSVFTLEADIPKKERDRDSIANELSFKLDSYPKDVPLLYGLTFKEKFHKQLTTDRVIPPRPIIPPAIPPYDPEWEAEKGETNFGRKTGGNAARRSDNGSAVAPREAWGGNGRRTTAGARTGIGGMGSAVVEDDDDGMEAGFVEIGGRS